MHIRPGKIWKTSILIFIIFSLLFPASNAFCEYNIYAASYTTYDTTYDDILKMYLRVMPAQCRNQKRRRHDLYNEFMYDDLSPYYMEEVFTPEFERLDEAGKAKKRREIQEKTLQYMKNKAGYAILDINGDGIDEMIIGRDNSYIYELFTMDNGKVRELIKAGARYTCNLLTDGGLYRFARDGAGFYSALLFQMNGTSKVVLDKGYAFNYELAYTNHLEEDDCWFKTNHPDHYSNVSMADHVPASEASSWIEECESSFAHLHFIPFSAYEKGMSGDGIAVLSVNGKASGSQKVRIRKNPDNKSKILAQKKAGTYIKAIGIEGDYYQVEFDRKTGYVHKDYITLITPLPDSE